MRPLIARACCCTPTPPGECSVNWFNCPEYVKFDLPGVIARNTSTVCTPFTSEQFWYMPHPQFGMVMSRGTSPYPAGWNVKNDYYRVTVQDILFRKIVYYGGGSNPPPTSVIYVPVPVAEQTATMYVTLSNQRFGTYAGFQSGGPVPMVIDTEYGDVAIPLDGSHASSAGSIVDGILRVRTGDDDGPDAGFCFIELEVDMSGIRFGGATGYVAPKTPDRTYNSCNDLGYSYSFDLVGQLWYRQKWERIASNDFWPCPGDLSRPEIVAGDATYAGVIPATGTVVQTSNDCNGQNIGCHPPNCLVDAMNCIYTTENQGLGFATNFRGSDTP